MRRRIIAIGGVSLAALIALAACAGVGPTEARDDSFIVGASPSLEVDGFNGDITVVEAEAGTIRVQATLTKADDVEYSVAQEGDRVIVKAEQKGGFNINLGQSPGARIEIAAPSNTSFDISTSNGIVEVRGLEEDGEIRTSNGRIVVEGARGVVRAGTSNGTIQVTDFVGSIDLSSSNGRISFAGALEPGSENEMTTSNGDISVELDGTTGVELDASTSNGRITSDLPITISGEFSDERLSGVIGNGGAKLVIRTSNGSVTVQ
ncbi:MAG: DUF4097 domain-containing protein [Chloroflexi bacterium]|nr:DUF4097 domain-containing protein [Chloroflexota bacterium]